ncbi:hypothetical protein TNIN_16881 [Trichonephila inaurata madagascariensis]|uniref:Uncharacterized protein n=1 Tax=Trichonephila inaurata madagascariensis TaxID=2747483 RepID=A0A8X7CFH3_9ARAC|nr:hypothetical protein TNIN_16881 [Trichonephila inaurata madagascariensis]
MLTGFRATAPVLQTLIDPLLSQGTTQVEKYRFYPPSARQILLSNTFSSHFGALTCTLRLRTRSRDVRDIQTRSIPLRDTERA